MAKITNRKNMGELSRRGSVFALSVAFSITASQSFAEAPEIRSKSDRAASVAKWFTPASKPHSQQELVKLRQIAQELDRNHGNGTYVCSASGFGQRSRCAAR